MLRIDPLDAPRPEREHKPLNHAQTAAKQHRKPCRHVPEHFEQTRHPVKATDIRHAPGKPSQKERAFRTQTLDRPQLQRKRDIRQIKLVKIGIRQEHAHAAQKRKHDANRPIHMYRRLRLSRKTGIFQAIKQPSDLIHSLSSFPQNPQIRNESSARHTPSRPRDAHV